LKSAASFFVHAFYKLQLMTEGEQCLWLRRAFLKNACVGAAVSLMAGIEDGAAQAWSRSPSLTNLSLNEISQLVRSKKVSPVELKKEYLRRAELLNPKLNAFTTVTGDSASTEARQAEQEIQRNCWSGPPYGIPIALKGLVDTAAVRTAVASGLYKHRIPTQDAEVVRRLKALVGYKERYRWRLRNSFETVNPFGAVLFQTQ
jgi:hypothetical protein